MYNLTEMHYLLKLRLLDLIVISCAYVAVINVMNHCSFETHNLLAAFKYLSARLGEIFLL